MALNYTKSAQFQEDLPGGKTNYIGDIILELNCGISSNGVRPNNYETLGIQDNDGIIEGSGIYLQTLPDGSVYYGDGDVNMFLAGDSTVHHLLTYTSSPCMFGTEYTLNGTPDQETLIQLRPQMATGNRKYYVSAKTSYGKIEIYKNSTFIGYDKAVIDCLSGDMISMSVIAPIKTHVDTVIRVTEPCIFTQGHGAWSEGIRKSTLLNYDIYVPNNEFLFFVEYEGVPQDSTIHLLTAKHVGIDYTLTPIEVANIKKYSTTSTNRMLCVFYRGNVSVLVNGKTAVTKNVMKTRKDANGNPVIDDASVEPIRFLKHWGSKVFKVLILSNVDKMILDAYRLERISIDGFEEGYTSKELVPLFTQYEQAGGGNPIPPIVIDAVFVGVYADWTSLPDTVFGQQWGIEGEGFYEQTGATNSSRRLIWGVCNNSEVDGLFA